jgi:hypothetical protein
LSQVGNGFDRADQIWCVNGPERLAMTDPADQTSELAQQAVSARIRSRIRQAKRRFNANDNIAEFIEPGELEALLDEVAGKMQGVLENLIGLSKYSRLAEWIMRRPQIQEEAITQIADLLMSKVTPDGLAVVMQADHFCMHWRGVKDTSAKMMNSVMRGSFLKDPTLRREFLSLINLKE